MDILLFLSAFSIMFCITLVTVFTLVKILFPPIKEDEIEHYYPIPFTKYLQRNNK